MPTSVPSEAPREADLPVRVGRYTLEQVLGEGGAGRVYLATLHGPAGFRKQLAVKLLAAEAPTRELAREARLGALLDHPNLVDVYDLAEIDGRLVVAMEWVRGPSLHRLIGDLGGLPGTAVLQLGTQLCAALQHAHELVVDGRRHPVVHRDLKPANVLLTRAGVVKVVDLGIAALAGTTLAETIGTPAYMAPEQVHGAPVDPRTDLFALGVVLAEAAVGRRLLGGRTAVEVMARHQGLSRRLAAGEVQQRIDARVPGLGAVVAHCLAASPDDRFPSAGVAAEALAALPAVGASLAEVVGGNRTPWPSARVANAPRPTPSESEAPTRPVSRSNLDPPTSALYGRQADRAALAERVMDARLVTVHGPGGIGKTSLVRRVGADLAPRLPGGAWFCDASAATGAGSLVSAVARVLEIPLGDGREDEVIARVGAHLRDRGAMVLILDNVEQVAPLAAGVLARWLDAAPRARFVTTSRVLLGLPEEQVLALGPLSEDDGVALLRDRASRRGGRAARWAEDGAEPHLRELCRRLDGLPLALELAAARAGLLEPEQVVERLGRDRFRMLRGARRGLPARQATLRGALDWSWELLSEAERATLAQLSVFRGGFSVEDAEGVVELPDAHDGWVLDALGALHDHALVVARPGEDGQPRFSLYESVRVYAAERVVHRQRLALRHARWYARAGRPASLARHRADAGRAVLAVDLENFVQGARAGAEHDDGAAAAGCARAAGEIFLVRGPFGRGVALVRQVLSVAPDELDLLWVASRLALYAGAPEGMGWAERALQVASTARERALASMLLAEHLKHAAGGERAVVLAGEAMAAARRTGDPGLVGSAALLHAVLWRHQGEAGQALEQIEQAIRAAEQARDVRLLGHALVVRGELCLSLGHYERGQASLERALVDAADVATVVTNAHGNLGILCRLQGELDDAERHYRQALDGHRALGQRRDEAIVIGNLGVLSLVRGDLEDGIARLTIARDRAAELGDTLMVANCTLNLAGAHERVGDIERAREGLLEARTTFVDIGTEVQCCLVDIDLGELEIDAGDVEQGLQRLVAARARLETLGASRYVAMAAAKQAWALRVTGDIAGAIAAAEEAVPIAREIGDPAILGELLVELGVARAQAASPDDGALREGLAALRRAQHEVTLALGLLRSAEAAWLRGDVERVLQDVAAVCASGAGGARVVVLHARGLRALAGHAQGEQAAHAELDAILRELRELGYRTVAGTLSALSP